MAQEDALVQQLVRPVVRSLARLGVGQQQLLAGPIEFTDMSWQTPPLLAEAKFEGVPLYLILDCPAALNVPLMYNLWVDGMTYLRTAPYKVLGDQGWRAISLAMPNISQGLRRLRLSTPDGFPGGVSEYAGITFSLEMAHALKNCAPCKQVVEEGDDYYVVLENESVVGVRDGLPTINADEWDISAAGLVQDMLRMPRGATFQGCDYDLISKLRSAVIVNQDRLPEFEALDLAMQALRVLADGRHLPQVQTQIMRLRSDTVKFNAKLAALREAQEISRIFTISDRARVLAIKSLLVPDFVKSYVFAQRLCYSHTNPPAMLTAKALAKLQQGLAEMIDEEENG